MRRPRRNCGAASTPCCAKPASSSPTKSSATGLPRPRNSKIRKFSSYFKGRDQDLLLEHNAELLKALEHIALRWLWLDPQFYGRVRFDAGGYRGLRIEELKLSARVAAERVRETQAPFRFNAMSSRERRILHLVLKEEPGVRRKRRRGRRPPGRRLSRPSRATRSREYVHVNAIIKATASLNPSETTLPLRIEHHFKCESGRIRPDSGKLVVCCGSAELHRDLPREKSHVRNVHHRLSVSLDNPPDRKSREPQIDLNVVQFPASAT